MTQSIVDIQPKVLVAIDISKERHDVLLELPSEQRKKFRIGNHKADFDRFWAYLNGLGRPCHIAFEATGNYHRPLASFLHNQGFKLYLVSSIATARTRLLRMTVNIITKPLSSLVLSNMSDMRKLR